jgi:hypothetical protein
MKRINWYLLYNRSEEGFFMNQAVMKPIKWIPFLALCLLVIGSNMILYMTSFFQPVPNLVVAGSMFDFLLVIPLLVYYFLFVKDILGNSQSLQPSQATGSRHLLFQIPY